MLKKFFGKIGKFEMTLPSILDTEQDEKSNKIKDESYIYKVLDKAIIIFTSKSDDKDLMSILKRPLSVGLIVISSFFGALGLWSVLAPIEGAVVADGQVQSLSNKKIVQHLEGGVIEEILIKDGEVVEEGQIMMRLKNISSKSQKSIYEDKLYSLKVAEARLIAERDSEDEVEFYINNESEVPNVIDNQMRLFKSRKDNIDSQINILNTKIRQSEEEKEGIKAQLLSEKKQFELVKEELSSKQELFKLGSINRPTVIALEKQLAILTGKVAEHNTVIARIEQQISSTKLEILSLQSKFQNEVVNELKDVQLSIADLEEKLLAIDDIFERSEIRAPKTGTVTNLQYHTIGGVIAPGATILEIIPSHDDLVIESKIAPKDIDAVLYAQNNRIITLDGITGNAVKVRVLALNSRKFPLLQGVMTYVSADVVTDPRNSMRQFYTTKISIPKSELEPLTRTNIKLYSGMPVAVYVVTESRTLLSYLFSPISSTFENAFRER